ncbi:glycoside hydrolase family 43 protein [Chromohalobacter sarecensis]|uniref:Glycoside hydrolase family 43 protein n=1 Tax=Chromohalobacter sarecensis TaxID=245294 RepID=A0ABV9D2Y4_9GAMM|nr:glycoside hydrolase family 43 protein [Chromohalobacter sarecensis]MCK0715845.1 glycoside hydrolase family 43 protein [Chromohalobacter sarecensis]
MENITNPILPGFNPDPSILRVGDNYYIATSTFEWFPGVQIHHSRDLVNWQLLPAALTRKAQIDMVGNIDSGGVWAPCLSYDDGVFYLIYTDVKSRKGAFKDAHNYLVTATDIEGPWSDPLYLNSSGFDPSLFHDSDGTKWLLNMIWDFRKGKASFAGIALQEYSPERRQLVGKVYNIFKGTDLGITEAPHIYKRNGYYYLMTAEGGTWYTHAVTMARASSLTGPYEVDPTNPILTSDQLDQQKLQKSGHGSLVETQDGQWYMAHLCARPIIDKKCILGRETALQKCYWTDDGWLRVEGGPFPQAQVDSPKIPISPVHHENDYDDFSGTDLKRYWNSLRQPFSETWISLSDRPGHLRLKGRESMQSTHHQSLLARRLTTLHLVVETAVDFEPDTFQQMSGLILYYDTADYVYLRISHDERLGKCIGIIESTHGQYNEPLESDIHIPGGLTYLRAEIENSHVQFFVSTHDTAWTKVGTSLDISHLSDDDADYIRFTGAFVGICAQDLSGQAKAADFAYFNYQPAQ